MPSTSHLVPLPPGDHDLLGYIHHMAMTAQSMEARSLFALYLQHEIRRMAAGHGEVVDDAPAFNAVMHGIPE